MLPIAQAIPCGLIINELVINSIKRAFAATGAGTITVSLVRTGDVLRLEVRDDGVGMVNAQLDAQRDSIGLRLALLRG